MTIHYQKQTVLVNTIYKPEKNEKWLGLGESVRACIGTYVYIHKFSDSP